jgi:hypothetical protein
MMGHRSPGFVYWPLLGDRLALSAQLLRLTAH